MVKIMKKHILFIELSAIGIFGHYLCTSHDQATLADKINLMLTSVLQQHTNTNSNHKRDQV